MKSESISTRVKGYGNKKHKFEIEKTTASGITNMSLKKNGKTVIICSPKESFSIEVTSKHLPVIKRLDRKLNHARTNHGYDYPDSGYTTGPNKKSSNSIS